MPLHRSIPVLLNVGSTHLLIPLSKRELTSWNRVRNLDGMKFTRPLVQKVGGLMAELVFIPVNLSLVFTGPIWLLTKEQCFRV